ncbi:hypothetical protein BH20ACI4_BH20ACI4_23540 [soil metagenome]
MSLQEKQNLLARLYTDENFRKSFLSEPQKTGRENNLSEREIAEIAEIIPEQLNFFADSLFWKRLCETEKFLPETKKELNENFANLFRHFSRNYNPQSVKKHLEDAYNFCEFLLKNTELSEQSKSIVKFEKSKLGFFGYGKRFVFCILDYNLKTQKDRKTFAVWFRLNGKNYHFVW